MRIISADWHIDQDNHSLVRSLVEEMIDLGKEKGCTELDVLGDIFESRKAQPLDNLTFFSELLEYINQEGFTLRAFPGNHDKVNYESDRSYLDEFKYHPAFKLVSVPESVELDSVVLHYVPFYKESTVYLEKLSQIHLHKKLPNILLTHIAVNGVVNNDGTEIQNSLTKELFKPFNLVMVGHYHNRSEYGNVHYIGSLYPSNFGEDNGKGCVVLNDNLSLDYYKLNFPEYQKVSIDLDVISTREVNKILSAYEDQTVKDHIRVSFVGDQAKLKAVDISKYEAWGLDVELKQKDVEQMICQAEKGGIVSFDKKSIYQEFTKFCKDNVLDHSFGVSYLKKGLNDEGVKESSEDIG